MKKCNILVLSLIALAVILLLIFGIFKMASRSYKSDVDKLNESYENYESSEQVEFSEENVTVVESTNDIIDIERRAAMGEDPNETANNDDTETAAFDYSGYEYWEQNALNTLAKTISGCKDDEEVIIISVDTSSGIGKIVVEKNGELYNAEFDPETYAILMDD